MKTFMSVYVILCNFHYIKLHTHTQMHTRTHTHLHIHTLKYIKIITEKKMDHCSYFIFPPNTATSFTCDSETIPLHVHAYTDI